MLLRWRQVVINRSCFFRINLAKRPNRILFSCTFLPSWGKSFFQLKCRYTWNDRWRLILPVADFFYALYAEVFLYFDKFFIFLVRVGCQLSNSALYIRREIKRAVSTNRQKVWQEKPQWSNCAQNRICTYTNSIAHRFTCFNYWTWHRSHHLPFFLGSRSPKWQCNRKYIWR